MKSREKGLITKEYLVMDTDLNFVFKWALHCSTLVIKLLTALQSCCKLQLLPQHYEPVFFSTVRYPYDTSTLKTKALHLSSEEEQVKHLLLLYKRLILRYLSLPRL